MGRNSRGGDPPSSHEAEAQLNAGTLMWTVLVTVEKLGSCSVEQIAAHCKMHPQKIWKRVSDVKTMGWIEITEPLGYLNSTGRHAYIVDLTDLGRRRLNLQRDVDARIAARIETRRNR